MLSYTQNFGEGSIMPDCLIDQMAEYIGTTVTVYTASGGESGCGFTGILSMITPCFIRLITCVGPAPCCSLGSQCNLSARPSLCGRRRTGGRYGCAGNCGCVGGCRNVSLNNAGSVTDIPLNKIAAFVHNAV